jgi:predicted nucleotidyltransferase component of viral defense system
MKLDSTSFNALLPKTAKVLKTLAKQTFLSNFTFVGGSCLALYLQHRQSEDLDFFTWEATLDKKVIQDTIHSQFTHYQLVNDSKLQQDWIVEGVKVTFFANNWEALKMRQNIENNLYVCELELIAALKINTLFLRAKFRDYYDLYAIIKGGMSIQRLFECAQKYLPSINLKLFQMALLYTDDIEEDNIAYLNPIYKIKKEKISDFFRKEIAKM